MVRPDTPTGYVDRVGRSEVLQVFDVLLRATSADPLPDATVLFTRPAWYAQAACAGQAVDVFFPARGRKADQARRVCDGCAVRAECLAAALADPELQGVWAGTDAHERARLRRTAA